MEPHLEKIFIKLMPQVGYEKALDLIKGLDKLSKHTDSDILDYVKHILTENSNLKNENQAYKIVLIREKKINKYLKFSLLFVCAFCIGLFTIHFVL